MNSTLSGTRPPRRQDVEPRPRRRRPQLLVTPDSILAEVRAECQRCHDGMFVDVDDCARIVEIRRCYVSTVGVHLAERIGRERLWKVESMAVGMMGATIATGVARRVFVTVRKDKAPDSIFDPTSSRFSWPDVVAWAAAAGVGL